MYLSPFKTGQKYAFLLQVFCFRNIQTTFSKVRSTLKKMYESNEKIPFNTINSLTSEHFKNH